MRPELTGELTVESLWFGVVPMANGDHFTEAQVLACAYVLGWDPSDVALAMNGPCSEWEDARAAEAEERRHRQLVADMIEVREQERYRQAREADRVDRRSAAAASRATISRDCRPLRAARSSRVRRTVRTSSHGPPSRLRADDEPPHEHDVARQKGGCGVTVRQFIRALELRERLAAIAEELDLLDADTDVPKTIASGLLADVDRLLSIIPADRRES
jgi:hypothetical protein